MRMDVLGFLGFDTGEELLGIKQSEEGGGSIQHLHLSQAATNPALEKMSFLAPFFIGLFLSLTNSSTIQFVLVLTKL